MPTYPTVSIPTLPTVGEFCLSQVHKKLSGEWTPVDQHGSYDCPGGKTMRGWVTLKFSVVSITGRCDPEPELIPNDSVIEVLSAPYILRDDGLLDLVGRFILKSPPPRPTQLFSGTIELMERIGTHHRPYGSEECNEKDHFEGWMVGLGGAKRPNQCLRALLVLRRIVEESGGRLEGILNGICLKPAPAA